MNLYLTAKENPSVAQRNTKVNKRLICVLCDVFSLSSLCGYCILPQRKTQVLCKVNTMRNNKLFALFAMYFLCPRFAVPVFNREGKHKVHSNKTQREKNILFCAFASL
jgi:hypothetical protein